MMRVVLTCAIALLIATDMPRKDIAAVEADEPRDERFIKTTDTSGRFLVFERAGNDTDRPAYVTVFEYLGEGKSLRKLYGVKLLNKYMPDMRKLSRDGRFLVTLGEWTEFGTGGPLALVIYDLARNEHTAYAVKDFLDERTIKSLQEVRLLADPPWCAGSDLQFNHTSTQFYPTHPKNCERERVPFVVVDLPTRTVRVQSIDSIDPNDIVPRQAKEWGWTPSEETVTTKTTILPVRMTWSCPGCSDRVLELAPNKVDYVPVKDQGEQK